MPIAKQKSEFVSYLVDLLQTVGSVSAKRMFGGYGFFLEGLMLALVADETFYLKTDEEIENDFKKRGLEAFTYNKKGKLYSMSYYQAPAEALENTEEMANWANKAYGAALRAAAKKLETRITNHSSGRKKPRR